ncbi:type II CRISPR RNA-guided endonuclease Cas9 [Vaginella massiliensis]|uniref:type II CRISPR RNA-guided endonuclease Cas9 n=1 Tax=Vaginella massiliensis TaxID=1816680 RepID=UPI0037539AA1
MKTILGLDLGTNSIGWALIKQDFENKQGEILGMGSRIIPMSQDILGDFGKGNSISQTAERTGYRGVRRLRERHLLRRERLHRVLHVSGFLPEHYAAEIDFEKRFGQFIIENEPKLAWKKNAEGKFEFLFQRSFDEMVADFKANGQDIKVPYDWTIYYLRKKALTQKISPQELAWIILNFNQKRGYYQLRGEEEDLNPNKKEFVAQLKCVNIVKGEQDKKNNKKHWYTITFHNGWTYSATFSSEPKWLNKEREFLITEEYDDEGNIKIVKDRRKDIDGKEKRRITPLPSFEEIDLMTKKEQDNIFKKIKVRTEITIKNSNKTVGSYIYEALLENPTQKIRGKLVRTIERKFYKSELKKILEKQIELQPELFTEDLYNACVRELYRSNTMHQQQLSSRDFVHLFLNDIIFYQRPLRSQKSLISNCSLENRTIKDKDGNDQIIYLKAIPKSNPYYQEFRVWQWLYNLRILNQENNADVTEQFIKDTADIENLFEFLMNHKEVNHTDILTYLIEPIVKVKFPNAKGKAFKDELKKEIKKYRWNYVYDADKDESKNYPMNETGYEFRKRLAKVENVPADFMTREIEQHLWHIIYSVTDKIEFEKALKSFANKYDLHKESFVENFKHFKPFDSDYGTYSEKAIKKLLPLLRVGKYWSWDAIDDNTKTRIGKIITGEYDETIKNRVREKAISLTEENHFQGLQLWLAQYIVYDRHSEASITGKWNSVADLEQYLSEFKQHSLRNPIVEQVITETLRVVRDIWKKYGKGAKDFFDEIHIELGREMKNTADERKRLSSIISENENTNLRIKAILEELMYDENVENVRPYSPMQQEALKIYEDGVLSSNVEIPEDIEKISKKSEPTKSEIQRYKLWLEQKYRSPYTGRPIPLSKLFTPAYQIEHIIPQARFFDDSFSNKVICESEVNELKDKQLGLEFIRNHYGQKVTTSFGEVTILTEDAYKAFVKEHYDKNRNKRNKLLMDEIPEKMIERQMNDTRYISKYISNVLSNLVRSEKEDEGINSKNIIPGNGKITGILKQDWGLNDVWNDLILPRFERMNQLTNSTDFTAWNEKHQKFLPTIPLELSKGFQKKRIDHRHHALDALIIACATRDHINLLNNKHAKSKNERYDLQHKLRHTEPWQDKEGKVRTKFTEFKKPWQTFTEDTKKELEKIVVSFKQNLRVINKATNYYEKIVDGKKVKIKQEGVNWAIRKPIHKETVSGKINLPRVKVAKGKILTATRKPLDTSFNAKTILSITDTGIQKILLNYLKAKGNPELAFSPEGIEEMNQNISLYNDGKPHQPILKVRVFEQGSKFPLGETGNKTTKYVEAAKGTNLFFGVYEDKQGKRSYDTIPLNLVIERQKQGLNSVPETNEKGHRLLFSLSPNDLVYVPIEGEDFDEANLDVNRIYKVVSFSGSQMFCVRHDVATTIVYKQEFSSLNKMERTIDSIMIKDICYKLKVDRLGNISKV